MWLHLGLPFDNYYLVFLCSSFVLLFWMFELFFLNVNCKPRYGISVGACQQINEWRQCGTMAFYSAIKKNETVLFIGKWMELENIMLSEISQPHKDKCLMFSLICGMYER
jgi:hypothetical protein